MKYLTIYKRKLLQLNNEMYHEFYQYFDIIEVRTYYNQHKNDMYLFDGIKANCILLMAAIKGEL